LITYFIDGKLGEANFRSLKEPMTLTINPQRWTEGFQDAYAGQTPRVLTGEDHSYSSGRVEGEALRIKHRQDYEQRLFDGRRVRPSPKTPT